MVREGDILVIGTFNDVLCIIGRENFDIVLCVMCLE